MSGPPSGASINQAWSYTIKTKAAMKTQRRFVNRLAWATTALLTSALWASAAALPHTVEQNFSGGGRGGSAVVAERRRGGICKRAGPVHRGLACRDLHQRVA